MSKSMVSLLMGLMLLSTSGCLSKLKTRQDLKGQTTPSQAESQEEIQTASEGSEAPAEVPVYKQEERNEQIRSLYGRVEEAENEVQELRNSMIELAKSRQEEKAQSEAKLQAYEEAIKTLEMQIQEMKAGRSHSKAPVADKKTESSKKSGKDSNARLREDFYRGEDFFKQKKWKDAIVSYQKYRESYPKGKMYPEATYQIGLCFLELGMKDESKSFFEEVRQKFPKSSLAKKAQKQLNSL